MAKFVVWKDADNGVVRIFTKKSEKKYVQECGEMCKYWERDEIEDDYVAVEVEVSHEPEVRIEVW